MEEVLVQVGVIWFTDGRTVAVRPSAKKFTACEVATAVEGQMCRYPINLRSRGVLYVHAAAIAASLRQNKGAAHIQGKHRAQAAVQFCGNAWEVFELPVSELKGRLTIFEAMKGL